MKIVLASDSHGRPGILEQIQSWEPDADVFLHCGDLCDEPEYYPEWLFVRGNNDYYASPRRMPDFRVLNLGGHKVYITHSHHCSYYNRSRDLANLAQENGCDVVCFGHTHVGCEDMEDGILLVNPGSCWMSRDGRPASYVVMDLTPGQMPAVTFKFETEWPGHKDKKKRKGLIFR